VNALSQDDDQSSLVQESAIAVARCQSKLPVSATVEALVMYFVPLTGSQQVCGPEISLSLATN